MLDNMDPRTKKYVEIGVPLGIVVLYVLKKRAASGTAATTTTAAPSTGGTSTGGISSSGNLTPGQLGDVTAANNAAFGQLQAQQSSLSDALGALTSLITAPTTSTPTTGVLASTPAQPASAATPVDYMAPVAGISYGGSPLVAAVANAAGPGYYQETAAGNVYAFGGAPFYGGAGGDPAANFPQGHRVASGITARPGGGYTQTDTAHETYSYGPDNNKPTT